MLPVYYNMSAIEVISDITNLRLTESARSTIPNTYFGTSKNSENYAFFFAETLLDVLFSLLVPLIFFCVFTCLFKLSLEKIYFVTDITI